MIADPNLVFDRRERWLTRGPWWSLFHCCTIGFVLMIGTLMVTPTASAETITAIPLQNSAIEIDRNIVEVGEAVKSFENRNFDACLQHLEKAIKSHPELIPSHAMFAKLAFLGNQPALIRPALERAVVQSGNTTNNGTFQENSGSTLFMNGTLTNYNSGSSTLTGGTYNAYSGTIQFSQANTSLGNVLTTNAATILLDGATAKIADISGNNILQGSFLNNAAAGIFTIQNGANLTSAASMDFTNAGKMTVGANSTFTVGGSHDFQNTGLLQGTGTIQTGLLNNSGTVHPGDSPGILSVTGNYNQTNTGHLDIQIAGMNPGTGFSQLNITGSAMLNGTLDLSLIDGFHPFDGEEFVILTSSGLGGFFYSVNGLHQGNVTFTVEYSPLGFLNEVVLDAHVSNSTVPEPASVVMLGTGLAILAVSGWRRRKQTVTA